LVWTEKVLVNTELGYAGTADLLMEHQAYGWMLVDLKTQRAGRRGMNPYPSWVYQLAAYRRAMGDRVACMNLIINSEEPGTPVEHLWSEEELEEGWRAFEAAQVIWRTEKNYDPRAWRPATTTESTKGTEMEPRNGTDCSRPTVGV
jgi:hypothetical protein